jgi:flagellar basal body-associated protein FliL
MRACRHFLRFGAYLAVGLLAAPLATPAFADDAPQRKVTQSESYVTVTPIYTSILDGTRPRGLLLVEMGLDIPDAGLRDQVNRALPLLRDAYVRSLTVYSANAVRPTRQPNVDDIAKRLQAITDHIMGRSGARVLMAQTAIRITH